MPEDLTMSWLALKKVNSQAKYLPYDDTMSIDIHPLNGMLVQHSYPPVFMHATLTVHQCLWDQYQYLGNCPPTPPLTQH